jgi:beta-phosphoglucomutase-like phosphatase (HAD superfamily)
MPPFKYAIFDFDGVIADTETVFARFDCALLNDVLVKAGLEPSL